MMGFFAHQLLLQGQCIRVQCIYPFIQSVSVTLALGYQQIQGRNLQHFCSSELLELSLQSRLRRMGGLQFLFR